VTPSIDTIIIGGGNPACAERMPSGLVQLHSGQYRHPAQLPDGAVLVVGTSQSGCQIAEELHASRRPVFLCVGGAVRTPRRYRGKDIVEWSNLLDLAKADQLEAGRLKGIDAYIDKAGLNAPAEHLPRLEHGYAVPLLGELNLEASGIRSVVWATGYRFDFGMVRFPVFGDDGYPIQERGVTPQPGLYFVGLPWLHTQKSGLLLGVAEDAAHVAGRILAA
jgi:hypothetical protein